MRDIAIEKFEYLTAMDRQSVEELLSSVAQNPFKIISFSLSRLTGNHFHFTQTQKYRLVVEFQSGRSKMNHAFFVKEYAKSDVGAVKLVRSAFDSGFLRNDFHMLEIPVFRRFSQNPQGTRFWMWADDYADSFLGPPKLETAAFIGELHSKWWGHIHLRGNKYLKFLRNISHFEPDWGQRSHNNIKVLSGAKIKKEILKVFTPERCEIVRGIPRLKKRILKKLEKYHITLLHQDFWACNIGNLGKKLVLIDWDNVGLGPAGAELAYFYYLTVQKYPNFDDGAFIKNYRDVVSAKIELNDADVLEPYYLAFCLRPAFSLCTHLLGNILNVNRNSLFNKNDLESQLVASDKIFLRIEKGLQLL